MGGWFCILGFYVELSIPNQFTQQLRISGNYIVKVLDENKEVVFSRKFILCEDLVTVPMQVKRARTVSNIELKHNLEFSIKSSVITFQNPMKNVRVVLLQNGQFNTAIKNVILQRKIKRIPHLGIAPVRQPRPRRRGR